MWKLQKIKIIFKSCLIADIINPECFMFYLVNLINIPIYISAF